MRYHTTTIKISSSVKWKEHIKKKKETAIWTIIKIFSAQ